MLILETCFSIYWLQVTSSRSEADGKRRRIEANLQEANARLQDAERVKAEQTMRIEKLERDFEEMYQRNEDLESGHAKAAKEPFNSRKYFEITIEE